MSNYKYIIKSLAPWMIDELMAFSKFTRFTVVFLRKQNEFYTDGLKELEKNGVIILFTPKGLNKIFKKLYLILFFFLSNIRRFSLDYNGVIALKSVWWFLKLDLSIFDENSNIHAQFATQASIIAVLIKKYYNNKPKFSFTFHAYDIYFQNNWFNMLLRECKYAFSISEYNIEYVKRHYDYSPKIVLSRLGVFPPKKIVKYKKGNNKIITLGLMSWFVEKKGINYLLEALSELKLEGVHNFNLILAGDGPLRKKYLSYIKKNNLSENVKYIGKIYGDQKDEFYESLDIFVLPSISVGNDQDGIPVVLMEAISFGLPLISTNVSGIPEICIDNYNGLLIEQKSVSSIKEAIKSFLIKDLSIFSKNSLELSKHYNIISNSKEKLKLLNWIN